MKKKYRLGVGYIFFYALLLAGATLGFSFFLSMSAGSVSFAIPLFLYGSLTGFLYVYTYVALVAFTLFLFLVPGSFQFTGLTDNSWNLLQKFGVEIRSLILNKLRISVLSRLAIYLLGFLFSFLLGFLFSEDRSFAVLQVLSLFLVGFLPILMMVTAGVALGAMTKGKSALRLVILGASAIAGFLLYYNGYFVCSDITNVQTSTARLISANPLGLVIIALIFAIVFPILTFTSARARVSQYNTEELDNETLVQLGIRDNMLILERGRTKYNVAISGPVIHDTDYDIPVPSLDTQADNPDEWDTAQQPAVSDAPAQQPAAPVAAPVAAPAPQPAEPAEAPVETPAPANDGADGKKEKAPRKKGGWFSRRKKDDDDDEDDDSGDDSGDDPFAQYEFSPDEE